MSKKTLGLFFLAVNLLISTTASANEIEFTNQDSANWDYPSEGEFKTSRLKDKFLSSTANIKWSSDQINFTNRQFFVPALKFVSDRSDALQPRLMLTDLPGAKFNRKLIDDDRGIETKVTVLDASKLQSDKS
ncbi:hypothetical protein [Paenibacillus sedimenti]|uniref:Uncharacterized protein n=1 Tax=Paenibacillus sedimenti TaxID=2770274 RepID=A0A926KTA4_9BACL|nr:hypothetical protein [Paenibacillus sedimenti]MBD0383777.1 hypothetical protein [Paenibacillus sedimenti]